MGTMPATWMSSKRIKTITFSVTDDCNLACTYCYFLHKNSCHKMTFTVAKNAVDYILADPSFQVYDGVVWDFIGGEPTLEIDLITKICDYIVETMYDIDHKWLYCYKFMIGTNGLLYSDNRVQSLIQRYNRNLQVSITIDGSKKKHDLSRIKKDGSGSYDIVVSQIPLWLEQQGAFTTKATFAHADIPFLKESIINLWNLGISNVMANVVFENCWQENDADIFEAQLKSLADYIIENELWDKVSVRFFDPDIGHPINKNQENQNFCGAGDMLTIDSDGIFYPCVRFMDSALDDKKGWEIGNVKDGIDPDRLRAFYAIDTIAQSSEKCLNCDIASGCSWCSGNNYCYSDVATIFDRKTYICEMHHANVRAAEYFWQKYEKTTGLVSPMRTLRIQNDSKHQKYMYILLDNKSNAICQCQHPVTETVEVMSEDLVIEAINYCFNNHIVPVFIGDEAGRYAELGLVITKSKERFNHKARILCEQDTSSNDEINDESVILVLNKHRIIHLSDILHSLFERVPQGSNISVFFEDVSSFTQDDVLAYQKQLSQVSDILFGYWSHGNFLNLNLLTHIFYEYVTGHCKAGIDRITLAPDGYFYFCPAFYYDNKMRIEHRIGQIDKGLYSPELRFCDTSKNTGCRTCSSTHCLSCLYLNKTKTGEFCVPPEIQCLKSNIERIESSKLYEKIKKVVSLDQRFKIRVDDWGCLDLISSKKPTYMRKFNYEKFSEN